MGDRTNPIKFGPEWLRNLALQRSIRTSPGPQPGGTGTGSSPPGMGGSATAPRPPTANPTPRVTLARLRYCREEMIALYDRQTAEAPAQLKTHDTLYVPRGQPPYALSNSYEDENRENPSRQPSVGSVMSSGDRYTPLGRGRGLNHPETKGVRGVVYGDIKVKARGYRGYSAGKAWHRNAFPDEDPSQGPRPWNNTNHQTSSGLRPNNGEQPEWQTKQQQYRMKRQTSTNWRQQHGRDDGEEWRAPDGSRRPQDKWAEWGWQQEPNNRPNQEKQWHNNRRTWMGGEGNEDALPEWAVENSEACGGTFDSSGAFHGYSNDDSNIPKTPETPYPLTKSHTHGSFARPKMSEDGYEEWWVSEKAKKLSPKRFDASEIQFKKSSGPINIEEKSSLNQPMAKSLPSNGSSAQNTGAIPKKAYQVKSISVDKTVKDKSGLLSPNKEALERDSPERKTPVVAQTEHKEFNQNKIEDVKDKVESRPTSDIQAEKGNFQSVILTSNNTLRQKHQNIVVTPTETPTRNPVSTFFKPTSKASHSELESDTDNFKNQKETDSSQIVEHIIQMTLDEGIPATEINQLLTNPSTVAPPKMSYRKGQVPLRKPKTNKLEFLGNQNKSIATAMPSHETYNGNISQPIGITNTMLNASLGLPLPNTSASLPQAVPSSPLSNPGLSNAALTSSIPVMSSKQPGFQQDVLQASSMQTGPDTVERMRMHSMGTPIQSSLACLPGSGLQTGNPMLQSATGSMPNVVNNMMFNNVPMPDSTLFGNRIDPVASQLVQQYAAQRISNPVFGNMMNQPPPQIPNLAMQPPQISDQWYYEDPNKTIQGPFYSQEMYHWYKAGFFNNALMVRRECETVMRPLGSYGPNPFGNLEVGPPFPLGVGYDIRSQQSHDNLINPQQSLGIDGLTSNGYSSRQPSNIESIQYNPRNNKQVPISMTVNNAGPLRSQTDIQTAPRPQYQLVQNNEVQSLWGQPASDPPAEHMWMPSMNDKSLNEAPIKSFPLFFWDSQIIRKIEKCNETRQSQIPVPTDDERSVPGLNEDLSRKELCRSSNVADTPTDMPTTPLLPETIKTEEEILAQMRAAQVQGPTSPLSFFAESPVAAPEVESNTANTAVNVNHLQNLVQKDTGAPAVTDNPESEHQVPEKSTKQEQTPSETTVSKGNKAIDKNTDIKPSKEAGKGDVNKPKAKETAKSKSKKTKEEKKEETIEVKTKDEDNKIEKRSAEPSPSPKNKKEEKASKKDLEKEKKEFLKDGFTLVKSSDRGKDKDSKKRAEDAKAAEEAERKRKEEEKLASEEKKRQQELVKKQNEAASQALPSRHAMESVSKKAPWSGSTQVLQSSSRDGPTLAEIQRLEREKKLEQMKEQQHMMQLIAQQQAAALAREQEVQTGLGWSKKPTTTTSVNQSLSEIQAEARRQLTSTVASPEPTPPPATAVPWSNVPNGGVGFWDCPTPEPKPEPKPVPEVKPEPKQKKKAAVTTQPPPKRETSPSAEFDHWCSSSLTSWIQSEIDVPTFISFLKDIESPYEVKDYVKYYLGDTLESNDFARQFLEKRSRLLRVGMVTPSDDLCSPAVAVNPRSNSSDHAELKTKSKKTKKNKMLKVDARNILGFSVTASEDRINVGDIDTV